MIGRHCFSDDTAFLLVPSLGLISPDLLNLVLTRFLRAWEGELRLTDRAKDSSPVWPVVIWSLPISELGKRNSHIWSLCSYWLLFLTPSVLRARKLKIFCRCFWKIFVRLFESFASFLRFQRLHFFNRVPVVGLIMSLLSYCEKFPTLISEN